MPHGSPRSASFPRLYPLLGVFLLPLAGCANTPGDPKQTIVGTWEAEGPSGVVWTFNPDGTATETLTKANKEQKHAYKVLDADKIDLETANPVNGGTLKMAGQFKFDGPDRLILLLNTADARPTRIAEAERADHGATLSGKGGGSVSKLRRKKG
jgi:hypothetical protein